MDQKISEASRNTIVIGAGEAGNMIIKELKSSKYLNQKVVCVIDIIRRKRENIFMEFGLSVEEI